MTRLNQQLENDWADAAANEESNMTAWCWRTAAKQNLGEKNLSTTFIHKILYVLQILSPHFSSLSPAQYKGLITMTSDILRFLQKCSFVQQSSQVSGPCLVLIIDACVCICAHSAAAQHDDSVWFSPSRKSVGRESKIDCVHMYNSQIENAVHSDCLTETSSSSSEYSMMHNGSKSLFLLPALQNKSAVYFWVNPFKKTKTHSGIIL